MFVDDSGSGSGSSAVFCKASVTTVTWGGDTGTSVCRYEGTGVADSGARRSVMGTTGVSGGGDTAAGESGLGGSGAGAGGSRTTEAVDST